MRSRRIYLDYAASAPVPKEAARARHKAEAFFANPSSIHADGTKARSVLEAARKTVAHTLGAHADEVVFTSTGTEADNLAILGAFKHARLDPACAGQAVHVITTAIEHPAVLEACKHIEAMGAEVTYLSVSEKGLIDPKELRTALRPETILVSIMYANNEIGTVQPIKEIAKEIRSFKKNHGAQPGTQTDVLMSISHSQYPLFHTDACQAAPYLNMNVEQLGVDILSLSGVKLGGGHGAAVLYVRRGTSLAPTTYGGEQERALRPGTENVSAIAALAQAFETAQAKKEKESDRLKTLRDFFVQELKNQFPKIRINGTMEDRLSNNVHVSFPKIQSELLVLELDAKGIAASAGSACGSKNQTGSKVLEALYGPSDEKEWGSVRFSFGPATIKRELEKTLNALKNILKKYESLVTRQN